MNMHRRFEFMNVRYQLMGRGVTGEVRTLYVNGQAVYDQAVYDFQTNEQQKGLAARGGGYAWTTFLEIV